MYIWIWAVLIVQGSLAVFGSLYMSFVKQEEQIIEVPVKPEKQTTEVLVKQPSTKKIKTIRKKLLF